MFWMVFDMILRMKWNRNGCPKVLHEQNRFLNILQNFEEHYFEEYLRAAATENCQILCLILKAYK